MPAGRVVADGVRPDFSRDGARLFLSTGKPPDPPADPDAKTPPTVNVDLWSYKDPIIQPMQKVRAEQERTRSYRAVVHLADRKFVQLATPDLPTVNPGEDAARALGNSDLPYRMEISWDQTYNDTYLVDLKTGQAQKILERWGGGGTAMSPGGSTSSTSTSALVTGSRTASATARASTSPRSCRFASSRRTTHRICRDRTARAGGPRTTSRSSCMTSSTSGR